MAGLSYSIPQSTLTVCDNMPEEWTSMEVRIPMKVGGTMRWPRVMYQREENGNTVRKTISVSGNPLARLRIRPWLEEGTVLTAPEGYESEDRGRNHIGYSFEGTPKAAVTIKIKK